MATSKEAFGQAVKTRINGDKNHGWGVDDSVEVIVAVICEECGVAKEDVKDIIPLIREVVNPSQFRQKLEAKGLLNKSEGRTKVKSILDGLL